MLLAVSFTEVAVAVTAAGVARTALLAAPRATNGARITSTTKELTGAGPHEERMPQERAAKRESWVLRSFIRQTRMLQQGSRKARKKSASAVSHEA